MSNLNEAPISNPVSPVATSPVKLASFAIPFIVAPTGTMANNGAITFGTAVPGTYANAYVNLPAGAIAAGSAAGWYFAQMSSTTVGVVFNNPYVAGSPPTIPAVPTPFVTTGPGAYTGVTGAVSGPSISVPGGLLGPSGALRVMSLWAFPTNANTKTSSIQYGGVTILSNAQTANLALRAVTTVFNQGVANANVVGVSGALGAVAASQAYIAINTALAQTLQANFNVGVATDYLILDAFLAEVLPGF